MRWNPLNTRIGLALGGGAAKGIAHIGVLKAFEEERLPISYLSGTSIGALIASYYAFGKSTEEILAVGRGLRLQRVINFTLRKRGFFTTDSIKSMILNDLGDVNIEQAKIPLAICTTDIETGNLVIFEKGNLAQAVCASVAVPGLFVPIEWEGKLLVDGGIVENVPVTPLEHMGAGIIVAVDLNGVKKYPKPDDITSVIGNAIDITMDLRTREQLKRADISVSLDLTEYSRLDNSQVTDKLFMEGYRPMKAKLNKLVWLKRANYLVYLYKVIKEILPLKIPKFVRDILDRKLSFIKFE